ncbi:hypothetical protein BY996DRAFT_6422848 [Phakopsora pachyrhizi]|nr:hypothetical protein BY996DRAFT_6422848 [Phakopsora pachyrhizi]
MFQINPNCHIPSNIRLAELRDMTYSMIHPYASLPHSQRGSFETNSNRKKLRLLFAHRSQILTSGFQDFDPYAADVQVSDLKDYIYTIDPHYQIPSGISFAKLCNLAFRLNPHNVHLPCTSKVVDKMSQCVSSTLHSAIKFSKNQSTSSGPRITPSPCRVQFSRHHLPPSGQQSPSSQVLAITKNSNHEFGGHSLEVNSDSEIDELDESNDTEDDGESYERDLHESKSDETDHLKISTNVNCRGPIKVQPQSKILQKQKASS